MSGPARFEGLHLAAAPAVISPRGTVLASVTTDRPIARVVSAGVEWGYTNFYRYRVARDGADGGEEHDTEDWVGITSTDLTVTAGEFTGGSSTFRVPSWAPGSSPHVARWSCRLSLQTERGTFGDRADFDVLIGSGDVPPQGGPAEHVEGSHDTEIDISLPTAIYRAGERVDGRVALKPRLDLPDGDAGVTWQRQRASHPLVRRPAAPEVTTGQMMLLGNGIELRSGSPVVLPFVLPLPVDAPPSATAVHSSLLWFVTVQLAYTPPAGHLTERVRRPIIVINRP